MRNWFLLLTLMFASSSLAQEPQGAPANPPLPDKREKLTLTIDPGRHISPVKRAIFNPSDSNQLITLADDGAIRVWDVADGKTTHVIYPPGAGAFVISKDGKRLAVPARYFEKGKEVPVLYVLSLPEGRLEKVLRSQQRFGRPAFSPDGRSLAYNVGGGPGPANAPLTLLLADLTRDDPPRTLAKGKAFRALAFSPDGKRLVVGTYSGIGGIILDLDSGKEVAAIKGNHVEWSSDGKTIAGIANQTVYLYDADGKPRHEVPFGGDSSSLAFSHDLKTVLCMRNNGKNYYNGTHLDLASGKRRWAGGGLEQPQCALSPDGVFTVMAGGSSGTDQITVRHTKTNEIYRQIKGAAWMFGGADFEHPAWSKDGKGVCWLSYWRKDKYSLLGRATFDLAELGFVSTLGKEQRYVQVLEKDGVMEKDGLILKRINNNVNSVVKDGRSSASASAEA